MTIGAELDSMFCKHTIQKKSEDSMGRLEPPNHPSSGYASGSRCPISM